MPREPEIKISTSTGGLVKMAKAIWPFVAIVLAGGGSSYATIRASGNDSTRIEELQRQCAKIESRQNVLEQRITSHERALEDIRVEIRAVRDDIGEVKNLLIMMNNQRYRVR